MVAQLIYLLSSPFIFIAFQLACHAELDIVLADLSVHQAVTF